MEFLEQESAKHYNQDNKKRLGSESASLIPQRMSSNDWLQNLQQNTVRLTTRPAKAQEPIFFALALAVSVATGKEFNLSAEITERDIKEILKFQYSEEDKKDAERILKETIALRDKKQVPLDREQYRRLHFDLLNLTFTADRFDLSENNHKIVKDGRSTVLGIVNQGIANGYKPSHFLGLTFDEKSNQGGFGGRVCKESKTFYCENLHGDVSPFVTLLNIGGEITLSSAKFSVDGTFLVCPYNLISEKTKNGYNLKIYDSLLGGNLSFFVKYNEIDAKIGGIQNTLLQWYKTRENQYNELFNALKIEDFVPAETNKQHAIFELKEKLNSSELNETNKFFRELNGTIKVSPTPPNSYTDSNIEVPGKTVFPIEFNLNKIIYDRLNGSKVALNGITNKIKISVDLDKVTFTKEIQEQLQKDGSFTGNFTGQIIEISLDKKNQKAKFEIFPKVAIQRMGEGEYRDLSIDMSDFGLPKLDLFKQRLVPKNMVADGYNIYLNATDDYERKIVKRNAPIAVLGIKQTEESFGFKSGSVLKNVLLYKEFDINAYFSAVNKDTVASAIGELSDYNSKTSTSILVLRHEAVHGLMHHLFGFDHSNLKLNSVFNEISSSKSNLDFFKKLAEDSFYGIRHEPIGHPQDKVQELEASLVNSVFYGVFEKEENKWETKIKTMDDNFRSNYYKCLTALNSDLSNAIVDKKLAGRFLFKSILEQRIKYLRDTYKL